MIAALDTAGPWVCVACGDASGLDVKLRLDAQSNHNELLPEAFTLALAKLVKAPRALAVNVGPGSFSGTRVGVSFAAGLGQALGLSVYPVSAFVVAASLAPPDLSNVRVSLPLVRGVWGVSDLSKVANSWQEGVWRELSSDDLEEPGRGRCVICPWGDLTAARKPPPDWNPAAVIVQLASLAPIGAFEAPSRLSVRYLGKCQAERNFDAGRLR
jgi:tRNA A37 threonylcarbamoyladenosine modification protein TsaB